MLDYAKQHKTIDGFPGGEPIDNEQLFGLDVDVLVPAALENQITMENAPIIRAKIVAEGANGPTTPEAHRHLHERGVFVIPDILANAGGVTTSYFEWVQDRHGYFWEEDEVNHRLEAKMCEAFRDVLDTSVRYKTDMRTGRLHRRHQPRRDGDADARDVRVGFKGFAGSGVRQVQGSTGSTGSTGARAFTVCEPVEPWNLLEPHEPCEPLEPLLRLQRQHRIDPAGAQCRNGGREQRDRGQSHRHRRRRSPTIGFA